MATERRSYALSRYSSIHVYADETQVDIANNRSYISTELWINGSSYKAHNVDCNVTGGGGYTNSYLTANGWVELVSGGFWASHNADGTGSAVVGSYYSSGYGTMPYGEFTLTLTTIPRASQPSINPSTVTAGYSCTIYTNRSSGSFTHTIQYSFGNKSGTIATGVGDSCSWTPSTDLLNQIPNSQSGGGTITCLTYNGSTHIGTKTCGFTLTVPNGSNPSVGNISLTEQHAGVKEKDANITVQQLSKKLVSVTVNAKYSASIKSVVCDGVTLSGNGETYTGYVSNKTSGTYTVTATDSRGLQSSNSIDQTYYAYSRPYIVSSLKRNDETNPNGVLIVSGTYSTILSNTISMTIQRNDETSATAVKPSLGGGKISFTQSYTDLYYMLSFSIIVVITDSFGERSSTTAHLGIGQYAFAMIKRGVVLGPDSYLFDKQNVMRSVLDFFYPVGTIYISEDKYFNPSTRWGGTWKKTADGRCLIGANDTYPLGSTGGEEKHTLIAPEIPPHKHVQTGIDSNMVTSFNTGGNYNGGRSIDNSSTYTQGYASYTRNEGGGLAHNNMQPYLAVYIWKRIA